MQMLIIIVVLMRDAEDMEKPRVLLDLDGVIRDWISGLKIAYRKKYPGHRLKEIDSRELGEFFPIGEEIEEFIRRNNREIIENAPPYPGAVETLNQWSEKFDLVLVTSQEAWAVKDTLAWLRENPLPVSEVIMTFNKEEVEGVALLDDFIYNLQKFDASGRTAVCMDRPWNREWQGLRVKSLEEYFKLVGEIQIKKRG